MVLPPLKLKIGIAALTQLRFGLVVLISMFSIGCQCPWSCSKGNLAESSRWLQGGLEAYHEGQHVEAQELLSKAAQTRPSDPILREHLAENYLQQGKTTEAIAELMQAADISGNDASVLVKIGNLYLAGGQQFPAEQYAKKALAANRKLPAAWVLNAEIKMAKGQLTEALSDYQRALGLDNSDPEVQIRIAEVQRLLGRPLRALSTVEQMLARMPEPSQPEEALLLSGRLLMELKQSAQAIEKLQLAVSKPDASAESHIQLAQTHLAVGQVDLARNTLLTAQLKFPNAAVFEDKLKSLPSGKERIAALNIPTGEYVR